MANNLLGSISWLSFNRMVNFSNWQQEKGNQNNLIDMLEPLLNNNLSGGSFYFNFIRTLQFYS